MLVLLAGSAALERRRPSLVAKTFGYRMFSLYYSGPRAARISSSKEQGLTDGLTSHALPVSFLLFSHSFLPLSIKTTLHKSCATSACCSALPMHLLSSSVLLRLKLRPSPLLLSFDIPMIRARFSSCADRRPVNGTDRSRTLCGSAATALVSNLHLFGGLSDRNSRSLSLSVSMQIACFDIRAVPSQFLSCGAVAVPNMHCDVYSAVARPAIAAPEMRI
jgi:hypothetical protein